jgi:hypothetical protein
MTPGGINLGGGGGGTSITSVAGAGANGGSGFVVLKYPSGYTATFSGGVTQTTSTSGSFKISQVTAAGVSDTVSWA